MDNLLSETTPQGSVGYTYDLANRRASMTVAGQSVISYTWTTTLVMSTSQHDQHEVTQTLVSLFEPLPDCICADDSMVEDLRVAVDLGVHFFFFLTDWTSTSRLPSKTCLEDIGIDISARAEFINLLGLSVRSEVKSIRPAPEWKPPSSFPEFRDSYFRCFAAMSNTETPKMERYIHLLEVCGLIFLFYGTTFI
jgi:YD repeat-containing protein